MKRIICFIDDSQFEHDLVKNELAPCDPSFRFIQAFTFEEALENLSGSTPSLFLLDLWGKDDTVSEPYLTPKHELEEKIANFVTLDDVFYGLENFDEDKVNEYLKRLFRIVDNWRHLFENVCNNIGQNRKYGLYNLSQVRKYYPGTPAVFYTRKSLISDGVSMFKAGAEGLFIKPTGKNDSETRQLTRDYAHHLINELKIIIDS